MIKRERPKIIEDIAEARSHGDLKENAEYHAAKERQGWIETRILRINSLLAESEIVNISAVESDCVRFGATVSYQDLESDAESTWKIVGEEEADFKERKISIKSPIAQAILGKEEGDEVEIKIPKGTVEVVITSIRYR